MGSNMSAPTPSPNSTRKPDTAMATTDTGGPYDLSSVPSLQERIEALKMAQMGHKGRVQVPSGGTPLVMPSAFASFRDARDDGSAEDSDIKTELRTSNNTEAETRQQPLPKTKQRAVDWPETESWARWSAAEELCGEEPKENSPLHQSRPGQKVKRSSSSTGSVIDSPEVSPASINKRIGHFLRKASRNMPRDEGRDELDALEQIRELNSFSFHENNKSTDQRAVAAKIQQLALAGGLSAEMVKAILRTGALSSSSRGPAAASSSASASSTSEMDDSTLRNLLVTRGSDDTSSTASDTGLESEGERNHYVERTAEVPPIMSKAGLSGPSRPKQPNQTSFVSTIDGTNPYYGKAASGRLGILERVDVFQSPWLQNSPSRSCASSNRNNLLSNRRGRTRTGTARSSVASFHTDSDEFSSTFLHQRFPEYDDREEIRSQGSIYLGGTTRASVNESERVEGGIDTRRRNDSLSSQSLSTAKKLKRTRSEASLAAFEAYIEADAQNHDPSDIGKLHRRPVSHTSIVDQLGREPTASPLLESAHVTDNAGLNRDHFQSSMPDTIKDAVIMNARRAISRPSFFEQKESKATHRRSLSASSVAEPRIMSEAQSSNVQQECDNKTKVRLHPGSEAVVSKVLDSPQTLSETPYGGPATDTSNTMAKNGQRMAVDQDSSPWAIFLTQPGANNKFQSLDARSPICDPDAKDSTNDNYPTNTDVSKQGPDQSAQSLDDPSSPPPDNEKTWKTPSQQFFVHSSISRSNGRNYSASETPDADNDTFWKTPMGRAIAHSANSGAYGLFGESSSVADNKFWKTPSQQSFVQMRLADLDEGFRRNSLARSRVGKPHQRAPVRSFSQQNLNRASIETLPNHTMQNEVHEDLQQEQHRHLSAKSFSQRNLHRASIETWPTNTSQNEMHHESQEEHHHLTSENIALLSARQAAVSAFQTEFHRFLESRNAAQIQQLHEQESRSMSKIFSDATSNAREQADIDRLLLALDPLIQTKEPVNFQREYRDKRNYSERSRAFPEQQFSMSSEEELIQMMKSQAFAEVAEDEEDIDEMPSRQAEIESIRQMESDDSEAIREMLLRTRAGMTHEGRRGDPPNEFRSLSDRAWEAKSSSTRSRRPGQSPDPPNQGGRWANTRQIEPEGRDVTSLSARSLPAVERFKSEAGDDVSDIFQDVDESAVKKMVQSLDPTLAMPRTKTPSHGRATPVTLRTKPVLVPSTSKKVQTVDADSVNSLEAVHDGEKPASTKNIKTPQNAANIATQTTKSQYFKTRDAKSSMVSQKNGFPKLNDLNIPLLSSKRLIPHNSKADEAAKREHERGSGPSISERFLKNHHQPLNRHDSSDESKREKSEQIQQYWKTYSTVKSMGSFDSMSGVNGEALGGKGTGIFPLARPSPIYEMPTRCHSEATTAAVENTRRRDQSSENQKHQNQKGSADGAAREGGERRGSRQENGKVSPPIPFEISNENSVADQVMYAMGPLLSGESDELDTLGTDDDDTHDDDGVARNDARRIYGDGRSRRSRGKGSGTDEDDDDAAGAYKGCSFFCGDASWTLGLPGLC